MMDYEAIVIGASAGGMMTLETLIKNISDDFMIPIIIVQHLHPHSDDFMARYLNSVSSFRIKEAEEKEMISSSTVYIAPANYHLLIEDDRSFSLSVDPKVNFCRPSIDVLFKTACYVYHKKLIGIILTGSNKDGAEGMRQIKEGGGLTIVQDPRCAQVSAMPLETISKVDVDHVLTIDKISFLLKDLTRN